MGTLAFPLDYDDACEGRRCCTVCTEAYWRGGDLVCDWPKVNGEPSNWWQTCGTLQCQGFTLWHPRGITNIPADVQIRVKVDDVYDMRGGRLLELTT